MMGINLAGQKLQKNYTASIAEAKILVVDDQPINIQVINQTLSADYNVFMATTGQQAIDFCLKTPPDLILMDVLMPGMSGLETCKKMKEQEPLQSIPIIFITGLQEQAEEDACWQAGGIDFITKPVNPVTLRNRVRAQLTLKFQTDLLRNMAYFDGLTGVYNRRYFNDYYARQVLTAQRLNQPLTILMIDIDYFKQFNDAYGHLAGDDCLANVAEALHISLKRPADLLARYGGEEFVAVLPDTDQQGAIHVAKLIQKNVEALAIAHESSEFKQVTVSIGIAVSEPNQKHELPLTQLADEQLYQAKAAGRNQYKI
ncbi:diguanylate cyclase [Neptunicella sp.]|uniref:diguanylate cyclase n=1 Tax=Neptunicella sp. TaxID=2125986 RepID=UPI003F6926B3